ncbi:hypothetical protein A6764_12195 [Brevibacillus sp. WF146]|uniref:hypothetical protein n=1 Tax=Brevibacillus sp. WF146 TaxID=319501 RepID=UPI0007EC63D2|nr:hypothetical protein [Brevibacillus sp. WF146]UYZ11622.1 hypothetical protein A6764_12195 [Brevibacillus sp. WF146]
MQMFFHPPAAKPTRRQPRTVGKQSLMLFKKLSSELNSRLKELFRLHSRNLLNHDVMSDLLGHDEHERRASRLDRPSGRGITSNDSGYAATYP